MKKFFAVCLAVLVMATLSTAVLAVNTYEAASALNNKVVVDGELDEAYVCAPVPVNYDAADGAATGTCYLAWDSDYLYMLMVVEDENVEPAANVSGIWSDDCAEFYINLSGTEGAIADINAAQYTFGPSFPAFAGGGLHRSNNVDDALAAYKYTDAGWNVEIAIPWGDEYSPAVNAVFQAAWAVNDEADGDGSTREAQTFAGPDQTDAWQNAHAAWDNLKLTDKEYVAPVPETEAEVVDSAPAAEAAPQTFDVAVIAAVAAVVSTAGYALTKKR